MSAMLRSFLVQNRATIVEQWTRWLMETYPRDTSKFLESQKNRFANPVGYTVSDEIPHLYDELVGEMSRERLLASIDNILRIRAVQDFSPSGAVGFVLGLKSVIRNLLSKSSADESMLADLLEFESRIDNLMLLAFESYMECREKVHEIRTKEIKMRSVRIIDRPEKGNTQASD